MKMKNKKAEQSAARNKHREQIKTDRRKQSELDRPEPTRIEKPTFLIVCEGENTEPSYFRKFKLSTATIRAIGEGYNTTSLVNRTLQLANKKKYDQVWCVFDKDDFSIDDFNSSIQIAESNNFGVAYSNQAFEYWILLHLEDHQGGGMHRNDYNEKLNELLKPLKASYDGKGSKLITDEIFEILDSFDESLGKNMTELAINRAKRNLKSNNIGNPAKEESSTTVYKLVEELRKHI